MVAAEGYGRILLVHLEAFLRSGDEAAVRRFLISRSHLPGPRANLELADAFAKALVAFPEKERERLWGLCEGWTALDAQAAPMNDPKEFLPFCGVRGLGAIGASSPRWSARALSRLRELASNSRWRTREAVAMAVQDLASAEPARTVEALASWVRDGGRLELRAVAAGVAEPRLLANEAFAKGALLLHRRILVRAFATRDRTSGEFKVLRQCLGYSISVVVVAVPKEGFAWMEELAASKDKDVLWVLRENLKKTRLAKGFPKEVTALEKRLGRTSGRRSAR